MSQIQNRFQVEYLLNYGYQQQPTANIGHHAGVHFSQFCFHMLHFVSRGEFKMLNFQVACAQEFHTNNFFSAASKYGMLLLICQKFRKNDT